MTRLGWAVLALLATAGARSPPPLPIPPIPPNHPPTNLSAPVPDPNVRAPPPTGPQETQVRVQDFRADMMTNGLGYTPGSKFQSSEDKRPIETPGLTVQVPLR